MLSAVRASPPARRAISSTSSSGTSAPIAAAPRRIDLAELLVGQRLELDDLAAGEQGRVDLEIGVLGRGADQRQQPVLDRGQQRVLLRLVEAVDLVEEEDRPLPVAAEPVARPLHDAAHVVDPGGDGRELLEGGTRLDRDDPGQRRLADSGRPVEDERAQAVLLDRAAERRPLPEDVLLADQLVERARPQPLRERRERLGALPGGIGEEVAHTSSMLRPVATHEDFSEPVLAGSAASDYERYLNTDELLALQKTADEWVHRDELLFQAVHQSSELWLKLAWNDVEGATDAHR